jgi:hypothetical protein
MLSTPPSFPLPRTGDWIEWREAAAIPARTPFLLSPTFDYDVGLNNFFLSGDMLCLAWNTQDGYARDLKAFLNFLWHNRNRTGWRVRPLPTTWPTWSGVVRIPLGHASTTRPGIGR